MNIKLDEQLDGMTLDIEIEEAAKNIDIDSDDTESTETNSKADRADSDIRKERTERSFDRHNRSERRAGHGADRHPSSHSKTGFGNRDRDGNRFRSSRPSFAPSDSRPVRSYSIMRDRFSQSQGQDTQSSENNFGDRPRRFGDRGAGFDRPNRFGGDRPERDHSVFRSSRPSFGRDRPERSERREGSFGRDRDRSSEGRGFDRPNRFGGDRPERDHSGFRSSRPSFGTDRPEGSERPNRFGSSRPFGGRGRGSGAAVYDSSKPRFQFKYGSSRRNFSDDRKSD